MDRSGTLRAAAVIIAAMAPAPLLAQRVVLTVTGGPVTVPAPAVADYNAGLVSDPNPLSYTVNIANGNRNTKRTTTVAIRSTSGTFGTLALSNLQWRRSDLATWTALTTANVTVESRQITRRAGNNWTNSILFRCLIGWTTVPPATYTANLVVTLTVTTP